MKKKYTRFMFTVGLFAMSMAVFASGLPCADADELMIMIGTATQPSAFVDEGDQPYVVLDNPPGADLLKE